MFPRRLQVDFLRGAWWSEVSSEVCVRLREIKLGDFDERPAHINLKLPASYASSDKNHFRKKGAKNSRLQELIIFTSSTISFLTVSSQLTGKKNIVIKCIIKPSYKKATTTYDDLCKQDDQSTTSNPRR